MLAPPHQGMGDPDRGPWTQSDPALSPVLTTGSCPERSKRPKGWLQTFPSHRTKWQQ